MLGSLPTEFVLKGLLGARASVAAPVFSSRALRDLEACAAETRTALALQRVRQHSPVTHSVRDPHADAIQEAAGVPGAIGTAAANLDCQTVLKLACNWHSDNRATDHKKKKQNGGRVPLVL